jgi:hypothetical protein
MTADYKAPHPSVAEWVYREESENRRQHARLQDKPREELIAVVRDRNETSSARGNALSFLLQHHDPALPDIALELLDDSDQDLRRYAIRYFADDPRIKSRLYVFLDDDNDLNWPEAAIALARSGDDTLLPRFEHWLHAADRGHRNVAMQCLQYLGSLDAQRLLQDFWISTGDEEDRLSLAEVFLSLGDDRGLSLLESTAAKAEGTWSVFAATAIYGFRYPDGLQWMMHILDKGDLEAKQSMVNQIWNFARLPHAFTADGIHEARVWVQSELDNPGPFSKR